MSGEHDEHDDELLLTEDMEQQEEAETPHDDDNGIIRIESDDEEEEATPLIKQLRQQVVDAKRETAELRRNSQPAPQAPPDPGPKPGLWDDDISGDEDKYDERKALWDAKVRAVTDFQRQQQETQQAASKAFERARAGFLARAAKVRDVDMQEAEQSVATALSPEWVGAIIESSPVSERVIAALHKYPNELQKVMDQPADWRRMRALWDLEQKVKQPMPTRNKPPAPEAETIQRGSAPAAPAKDYDKQLAALEKEAERTGKRDKIIAFKRQHKERAK